MADETIQPRRLNLGYWIGTALVLLTAALLAGLLHPFYPVKSHLPARVWQLPQDAAWSLFRMIEAYVLSLVFAMSVGVYAYNNQRARQLILPILDILQSIPIVSFFPAALAVAVWLFGGGRLGFEIAAIVLIFTSMSWNMAFSVYESLIMVPQETIECAESFGIRGTQRFFTITLPVCVPGLLYNSIVSWAAGWFALTACEILSVNNRNVTLPGIGSFLQQAANSKTHPLELNLCGVAVLLGIILMMEIFIWRPLAVWAERFRYEVAVSSITRGNTGVLGWYQRGWLPRMVVNRIVLPLNNGVNFMILHARGSARKLVLPRLEVPALMSRLWRNIQRLAGWLLITAITSGGGFYLFDIFRNHLLPPLAREIPSYIGYSFLRILAAYVLSMLWVVPAVLWARTQPRIFRLLSSISQTMASMPPIALTFIVISIFVEYLHLGYWGVEAAGMVLLMNGVQWYVLFNMLGGIAKIPGDLKEVCNAMGLSRWQQWKNLVIPAILPSLFTGTITAFGGGWNTLIFSECITYAGQTYKLHGIGWLLDVASGTALPPSGKPLAGPQAQALLFVAVGCLMVLIVVLNRLLWKRLQAWAADRFRLDY
ncbi:MAG: ABC transporter permease subunit [Phycisphaerae bacterium]